MAPRPPRLRRAPGWVGALVVGMVVVGMVVVGVVVAACAPAASTGHRLAVSTTGAGPASTPSVAPTTTVPSGPVQAIPTPPRPTTEQAVLAALAAPETVRIDPASTPAQLAAAGAAIQTAEGTLADHPDWLAAVLAGLPAAARAGVQADVTSDQELTALYRGLPALASLAALPGWSIRAPLPAAALLADYHESSALSGVPWNVLAAINLVETRMGRIVDSQGPMQFLPATWKAYGGGGDVLADRDAILAAGRLLAADGAANDLATAVRRYNGSPHYATAVLAMASVMGANPRDYYAYYGWQVYVATTAGQYLLPVGYRSPSSS